MKYEAIKRFKDLESEDTAIYNPGDTFPSDSREITKKRIDNLLKGDNRLGYPVIKEVRSNDEMETPEKPKDEATEDVEEAKEKPAVKKSKKDDSKNGKGKTKKSNK